jgi:hypothetical protein
MTDHITNYFAIRLRATQALGQGVKSQALAIIENLFAQ